MSCREELDYKKCKLLILDMFARFNVDSHEVTVHSICENCHRSYWQILSTPKIEDFGQVWRAAVNGKQYKPE